jgi:hypothetical protein
MKNCPHCGKSLASKTVDKPFTSGEIQRFWNGVQKQANGCWIYQRGHPTYGRLSIGGKAQLAHVASWKIHGGTIPDGHVVMHNCPSGDNPKCVNPAHLKTGTQRENCLDKVKKGRANAARGTRNHLSKLDEKKVIYIRQSLANESETIKSLAEKLGSSFQGIYHVALGQVWRHVGGPLIKARKVKHFTKEEILEIRSCPNYSGYSRDLAKKLGCHESTIIKIWHGHRWKNIHPETK